MDLFLSLKIEVLSLTNSTGPAEMIPYTVCCKVVNVCQSTRLLNH